MRAVTVRYAGNAADTAVAVLQAVGARPDSFANVHRSASPLLASGEFPDGCGLIELQTGGAPACAVHVDYRVPPMLDPADGLLTTEGWRKAHELQSELFGMLCSFNPMTKPGVLSSQGGKLGKDKVLRSGMTTFRARQTEADWARESVQAHERQRSQTRKCEGDEQD
jgi:hypothetical protein